VTSDHLYYSKGGADMEDRVAKTSIFGFAVGALDAYRPAGSCIVEYVKTRLVHAAVRHLLQQSPHWGGDIPISQEDMLVLGIKDEYVPATWDAAYAQSDQILPRNMGPTQERRPRVTGARAT
jgi:endo-cleaving rubber dioxygenase